MVWQRGTGQATYNLQIKDGQANLQLSFQLGKPDDHHLTPPAPRNRPKGERQKERDRERAAAHHARRTAASAASAVTATETVTEASGSASAQETPGTPVLPPPSPPPSSGGTASSESNGSVKEYLTEKEKEDIEKARPSYCKLCRTCEEETDTAEDLNYHLMNNHQPQEVLANYGQTFIEERRYCIRKGSPFSGWFFTPLT